MAPGSIDIAVILFTALNRARLLGRWVSARLDVRNERGATAVEYAVMVALIAAVIVIAVVILGRASSSTFSQGGSCVQGRTLTSCPDT